MKSLVRRSGNENPRRRMIRRHMDKVGDRPTRFETLLKVET
jgi:hypothetical protein